MASASQSGYEGNYHTFTAWLFSCLVLLAGFTYARNAISALLMKLHELLIQNNTMSL